MNHVADAVAGAKPVIHVRLGNLRERQSAEVIRCFQQIRHLPRDEINHPACMYGPAHDKPLRRLVEIRAQRVVGVINSRVGPDGLNDPEPLQTSFRDFLVAHEELRLQLVVVHPCGDSPRRTNVDVNLAAAEVTVMLYGFFKALAHLKPLHGLFELFYPIRLVFIADSFELYPFAGHFFRNGAHHLAIFRFLRQRGQVRIAGEAL